MLRRPGFHEPSDEERDTVCRGTWSRYHCLTHDRPWWHGGVHCPSHHHHEVARFCGAHGLEVMWPQPLMTAEPGGFDPPLSAVQLDAVDAAWNDEG